MDDPRKFPHFTEEDLRTEPIERSETILSTWYTDPGVLDFENKLVFLEFWQYLGRYSGGRGSC